MAWDSMTAAHQASLQDELVRDQVRVVASAAPWWKRRFADLGLAATAINDVAGLRTVTAVGERDVSPNGDPAAMAGLVLHATEQHFALHAAGPQLRRALALRVVRPDAYRQVVEQETKPTTYLWSGLGFRYPLACTRGDLDLMARAGARLWAVLGLTGSDALLSAAPVALSTQHQALAQAALAAGAPALFPGAEPEAVRAAARLAPPTVLAVAPSAAPETVAALAGDGLRRLHTLLLVDAPSPAERAAAVAALATAGVGSAAVLAVHAPAGARVLWAECRASGGATGLHTYPDLELAQVVDAETGTDAPDPTGGELVLTQLGWRGTALLRWRTGDLVAAVDTGTCSACGRTVPRVRGLVRRPLVVATDSGRALDLRALAGALSGRADISDWRVQLGPRRRDGRGQVVVHLVPAADAGEVAVGAAADIRTVAGMLPTQLVTASAEELAAVGGVSLTRRLLVRPGA